MRLMKELQNGQRLEKPENAACHDEMLVYILCAVTIIVYICIFVFVIHWDLH